jgi:hypothetical protein
MTIDTFLETAWTDHGDHPQEVADRMATSFGLVTAPDHIAPFARLLTHVYGEHLGQWPRGIELLESMRSLPAFDGSAAAAAALDRNIATLRYAGGDDSALAPLATPDRAFVLAGAAAAFAGRKEYRRAITAYADALRLAEAGMPAGSPALRALAVGGNNLAAALEEKRDRDVVETDGMVMAAQGGLTYWRVAGTWLEEERANYRLTRSLLQANRPAAAVEAAARCVEVCARNNAPPFEQFFGHAVLALASRAAGDSDATATARARAITAFGQIPADERQWCQDILAELGA